VEPPLLLEQQLGQLAQQGLEPQLSSVLEPLDARQPYHLQMPQMLEQLEHTLQLRYQANF
jgi:hypothetical protein